MGYRSSKFKIGDVVRFKDRKQLGYVNDWSTESGTVISHYEMFMITEVVRIKSDDSEYWGYTLVNDRLKDTGWDSDALEIVIPRAGSRKSGKIRTPRQPAAVQPEGA